MMEGLVAARPITTYAAADLTGRLDNIFMWQDLRLPAGPNVGVSYSVCRQCKRKFSVLKRGFRFDDVRSLDVFVAGFDTGRDSKASDSNSCHERNDHDLQVGHLIGAVHRMVHDGPQTGFSP